MAFEKYFDLIKSHILPLLLEGGFTIDPSTGLIINTEDPNIYFKFINQKYNGEPNGFPYIIPMAICSDQQFLITKDNTNCYELFNPFVNRSHMFAILIKLKNTLVTHFVSNDKFKDATCEEDYEEIADKYLMVYNSTNQDGTIQIGVNNIENPDDHKTLFYYNDDNVLKAAWGLCVEIYKYLNPKKIPKVFLDIDKGWRKAEIELEKWNKIKQSIIDVRNKEHRISMNANSLDLSDSVNNMIVPIRNFDNSYYIPASDSGYTDNMDSFLTSLFDESSLLKAEDKTIEKQDIMEPTNSIDSSPKKYVFQNNDNSAQQQINSLFKHENITKPKPSISIKKSTVNNTMPFQQNLMNQYNNPYMSLYMSPQALQNQMIQRQISNNNVCTDIREADLTGGDYSDPYSAYLFN